MMKQSHQDILRTIWSKILRRPQLLALYNCEGVLEANCFQIFLKGIWSNNLQQVWSWENPNVRNWGGDGGPQLGMQVTPRLEFSNYVRKPLNCSFWSSNIIPFWGWVTEGGLSPNCLRCLEFLCILPPGLLLVFASIAERCKLPRPSKWQRAECKACSKYEERRGGKGKEGMREEGRENKNPGIYTETHLT